MCLSNNRYPSQAVDFSDTIILALEANIGGDIYHVLGYSNGVRSSGKPRPLHHIGGASDHSDFGWDVEPIRYATGNAMLFAIPAEPGTFNDSGLMTTARYPHFMRDYARPFTRDGRAEDVSRTMIGFSKDHTTQVVKGFDEDTYDVIISSKASAIPSVIDQVDLAKRPAVNQALYNQLDILYPGWTFVLFCFEEMEKEQQGCALMRYKPMKRYSHLLYAPGLDGHNGEVEKGNVHLNHTLIVGTYNYTKTAVTERVYFREDGIRHGMPWLSDRVIGRSYADGTEVPQGDFLFLLEDVRQGNYRARRMLPPGWGSLFGAPTTKPVYI